MAEAIEITGQKDDLVLIKRDAATAAAVGVYIEGNQVLGPQQAHIVSLTDSTTGTATDTLNDTTAGVKDDIASLAAKIQEILVVLETHGLVATS